MPLHWKEVSQSQRSRAERWEDRFANDLGGTLNPEGSRADPNASISNLQSTGYYKEFKEMFWDPLPLGPSNVLKRLLTMRLCNAPVIKMCSGIFLREGDAPRWHLPSPPRHVVMCSV